MSYTPDIEAQVALDSKARGLHWLIDAHFSSGIGRYTTAPIDVVSPNGQTYIGLGQFIAVEPIEETADPDTSQMTVRLAIVNKAMLAFLTGDQSVYRGKTIVFHAQFFNRNFKPVSQPVRRWQGVMAPIKIQREKADDQSGRASGFIELPCVRRGMQRARNNEGLRMTHEQQILNHPGDLFFEHMSSMVEKPQPWLTIAFQKQ